ncbi:copper resistance protein B [Sphingomonas kyeonggiensis]|uniref:Copper resistance protein B n=1 Tax=Sphingomonas kyeonggiensis TaxID=1268553 RepID=A0A7W7NRB5_9SPHN|nr:copper resistance protein B [Sphingomonas kyeonggiensis]MBB4838728.1 copper resistance protein B [Sphingomonas kyeonggiensis]
MKARWLSGAAALVLAVPAMAQDHSGHAGHDMSAMPMPAPSPTPVPADPHAGHDMAGAGEKSGTDLPAGNATAPAPVPGRAADRFWGAEAMADAQRAVRMEHGGMALSKVMLDLAEVQLRSGETGYRWQGEGWWGGDIHRLWIKSQGEGVFRKGIDSAEVQALYGRAIDPYWNLQAGVRQDLGRGPRRTWAVLAVEGLAPYWFDLEGSVFLSGKGDVRARIEGSYDQRITQSLILQPRAELNLSAQDMPANGVGAGLSSAELGLRLRYERVREFAPYVGVSWERSFGRTADYARARGDGTGGVSFVAGVRAWF